MPEIKQKVQEVDNQLKRFQAASVDYVLDQFYNKNRKKVLIADEVGLGKTIIAKGIIAKSVDRERKKPFHVVYICSNQVLAHQNITKLNPFGNSQPPLSRLIFLAKDIQAPTSGPLKLSTLTPDTSLKLTNSVGLQEERAIIFKLLYSNQFFQTKEDIFQDLMTGNRMIDANNWNNTVNYHLEHTKLRKGLDKAFTTKLKNINFGTENLPRTNAYLNHSVFPSFYSGLKALLSKLEKEPQQDPIFFSYEIIKVLRRELTLACVPFLEADLFILDEFQRFKTVLDDNESEAGVIAKAVLHNIDAKVLLLSATPFKPYTTRLDQLNGEDHHDEFKRIVEFLGGQKLWNNFRKDQEAFFNILRFPREALEKPENALDKKKQLEETFKRFISRNERLSVAQDYNNMIANNTRDNISVIESDIRNFIALDQLVIKLDQLAANSAKRFGSTIEFAKSAPFPLSFLHGYKLHEHFFKNLNNQEIKSFLKKNKQAGLSHEKINNYKPIGFHKDEPTYPNGKLRKLAEECFSSDADKLLWMTPTKPYYKSFGAFKKASDFSKVLVFSGWLMAPRAISTLLSYEVERRTIGSEKTNSTKEKETRTYFQKKRKPAPLFTYSKSNSEDKVAYQMANSLLTYPCKVLSEINILSHLTEFDTSYSKIKQRQISEIRRVVKRFNIKNRFVVNKKVDNRWYWVLPALLDYLEELNNEEPNSDILDNIIELHSRSRKQHYIKLQKTIQAISSKEIRMGLFPDDLYNVMADVTCASPANAALFAYSSIFNLGHQKVYEYANTIAHEFISLFNKPESISAIRLTSKGNEYWRQVLNYCASGNICSMMDEYFYMLKDCNNIREPHEIKDMLVDVLSVNTSSINVDLHKANASVTTKNMRCHFAVSFGEGKMETNNNRSINIRTVFNSPFRPFVLASTSIGQEGLDFHYYCRKVFHWNLPYNAIDIEQREGRINRYKGFVIRKKIAEMFSDCDLLKFKKDTSVWEALFNCAETFYNQDISQIKPFWYIDNESSESKTMIERFVPIHELSKDKYKYEQLKSTLALYRLTFGQPRQEELIEAFRESNLSEENIKELRKNLLINLSPLKQ